MSSFFLAEKKKKKESIFSSDIFSYFFVQGILLHSGQFLQWPS